MTWIADILAQHPEIALDDEGDRTRLAAILLGAIEQRSASLHRREFKSTRGERRSAKERRDLLRGAGLCINGEKHGKATNGVRCEACAEKHRKTR